MNYENRFKKEIKRFKYAKTKRTLLDSVEQLLILSPNINNAKLTKRELEIMMTICVILGDKSKTKWSNFLHESLS